MREAKIERGDKKRMRERKKENLLSVTQVLGILVVGKRKCHPHWTDLVVRTIKTHSYTHTGGALSSV